MAVNGQCKFQSADVKAKVDSWYYVTSNKNETQMASVVANVGPVSICVDASTWQFYMGGVVTSLCEQQLDHCVQLVGFEEKSTLFSGKVPVWIVRNSWGADWGEQGYIWIERNKDLCGIAD